jgi:DNA-binding transcriptional LysR family regulator
MEIATPLQPSALRERRVELGLCCAPVEAEGTARAELRDLVEVPLVRERLVVALPGGHALARRKVVRARDLDGEPMVGIRPDIEPSWARASMRALHAAGAAPQLVQETDTKVALLGLVAAGLGLSPVSESMMQLGRRGVVFRPLSGVTLRLTLSLLVPTTPTPRALAFLELAKRTHAIAKRR